MRKIDKKNPYFKEVGAEIIDNENKVKLPYFLGSQDKIKDDVKTLEKWLKKYGTGKALVLARFVPFVRTLINPMCGVIGLDKKQFRLWNIVGGIIWTEFVIGLGYILGDVLKGSVDKYLLPVIALIIAISLIPVAIELFKEWQSKRFKN